MQGARVQSLVRELRSHMLHGQEKRKEKSMQLSWVSRVQGREEGILEEGTPRAKGGKWRREFPKGLLGNNRKDLVSCPESQGSGMVRP